MNSKISNDRLPLEISADRHETLRKYVSGDSQHFVFRIRKFLSQNFVLFSMFLLGFWRATPILTSPADSWQFFALDWPIMRSVRSNFIENTSVSDFVFPFFFTAGGSVQLKDLKIIIIDCSFWILKTYSWSKKNKRIKC